MCAGSRLYEWSFTGSKKVEVTDKVAAKELPIIYSERYNPNVRKAKQAAVVSMKTGGAKKPVMLKPCKRVAKHFEYGPNWGIMPIPILCDTCHEQLETQQTLRLKELERKARYAAKAVASQQTILTMLKARSGKKVN